MKVVRTKYPANSVSCHTSMVPASVVKLSDWWDFYIVTRCNKELISSSKINKKSGFTTIMPTSSRPRMPIKRSTKSVSPRSKRIKSIMCLGLISFSRQGSRIANRAASKTSLYHQNEIILF